MMTFCQSYNLSILDFKCGSSLRVIPILNLIIYPYWILNINITQIRLYRCTAYNLSILDFKLSILSYYKLILWTYNLSILDFKSKALNELCEKSGLIIYPYWILNQRFSRMATTAITLIIYPYWILNYSSLFKLYADKKAYNLSILDFKWLLLRWNKIRKILIIYPYWILNVILYLLTLIVCCL